MQITIEENKAVIDAKLDTRLALILPRIEGRKCWLRSGNLSFLPTAFNLDLFREQYPNVEVFDRRVVENALQSSPGGLEQAFDGLDVRTFRMRTEPFEHQKKAFENCKDEQKFALFMDQGTGKTKVAIDKAAYLWINGKIEAMLIITLKGVHRQWIEVQIPTHMSEDVPVEMHVWKKKDPPEQLMNNKKALCIFSINIDAISTKAGLGAVTSFILAHHKRVLVVIDESQTIKSYNAVRTKVCYSVGRMCAYRMIMTGTPISKSILDQWSQFKFLDENIIGHRFLTSFNAEYSILGGWDGKQIVGIKNLAKFQEKVAPYIFRVTKEEALDLPPKIYDKFIFDMHPDQKRHFDSLKKTFLTMLDTGEIVSVVNAAVLMTRLQQITCGVLPIGDGTGRVELLPNPRMEALLDLLEDRQGKVVIWARFQNDIKIIMESLKDKAVAYYGEKTAQEREDAKRRFIEEPEVLYFVATTATGGTGLDGLQTVCDSAIYYSNTFNAIDRWQSEDRLHRIGTKGSVLYTDLVCKGSPDNKILANLRGKKSLSDLALGDIRSLFDE